MCVRFSEGTLCRIQRYLAQYQGYGIFVASQWRVRALPNKSRKQIHRVIDHAAINDFGTESECILRCRWRVWRGIRVRARSIHHQRQSVPLDPTT